MEPFSTKYWRIAGQFDLQAVIEADGFPRFYGGDAIDVALDKVTAKAAIGREGSLEVDEAAGIEAAQVGAAQGFLEQIKFQAAIGGGVATVRQQPLTAMLSPSWASAEIAWARRTRREAPSRR